MRTEPCVCGGSITAPSLSQCRPFVVAHQASLKHLEWRYRRGYWTTRIENSDDPRRRPTADQPDCDVSDLAPVRPPPPRIVQ